MSKLQDVTKREMFQSHIAAATGQSIFGNLHSEAGPGDSWSEICKLLIDTATERLGTEPGNRRDWFDESDDSTGEKLKGYHTVHDIYLKSHTTPGMIPSRNRDMKCREL